MKYYNLPTAEQIAGYHNGTLSIEDQRWIESSMQKNPFVNEAVQSFPASQLDTIQQISERVGTRIQHKYMKPNGFWSKYGVWIGLSSIAVILSIAFLEKQNVEQRYFQNDAPERLSVLTINEQEEINNEEAQIKTEQINPMESYSSKDPKDFQSSDIDDGDNFVEQQKIVTPKETEKEQESEQNQEGINLSGKLLKNIRGISIIEVDKGGLKRREIPEFPGGNIGLTNHFQSFITPVELQYGEPLYDPKIQVILDISANGKLKNHEVMGYMHEQHQKQIGSAIEKLPQFKPGKGGVSYTVEVKFN